MQQVEWRALLCFGGDNINRAMNPTFTAIAIAMRGVADMSQNFLLLFLNFHTIADRGQTQDIVCRSHPGSLRAFIIFKAKWDCEQPQ